MSIKRMFVVFCALAGVLSLSIPSNAVSVKITKAQEDTTRVTNGNLLGGTLTQTSSEVSLSGGVLDHVDTYVYVSSGSKAGTLDVKIQCTPDGSKWIDIASYTQITTTSTATGNFKGTDGLGGCTSARLHYTLGSGATWYNVQSWINPRVN